MRWFAMAILVVLVLLPDMALAQTIPGPITEPTENGGQQWSLPCRPYYS